MAYYWITDFKGGLDRRRESYTAPAGTLRELINAFVNEGGEIEKRLGAISVGTIADTIGLYSVGEEIYTLTNTTPAPSPIALTGFSITPVYIAMNSTNPIAKLLDWDLFDGLPYLILEDTLGNIEHWYNGAYVASGLGTYIETFGNKVYSVDPQEINFSSVGNPSDWNGGGGGTGYGTINPSVEDADSLNMLGLEIYYDRLAALSERTIQLWSMDPDPTKNQLTQTLRNIGTVAPRSVKQYGSGDILFLSDTGIRSLRARDSSNNAQVTDIGSPIDRVLRPIVRALTTTQLNAVRAVVDETTGQFQILIDDQIYLLSYYPAADVSAWCQFDLGFTPDDFISAGHRQVLKSGTTFYIMGDEDEDTYDASQVTVTTPYLSFDLPATTKIFGSIDAAVEGTWTVEVSYDPLNIAWETVGTITGPSFTLPRLELSGSSTHIALRFKTTSALQAKLSSVIIHYEPGEAG